MAAVLSKEQNIFSMVVETSYVDQLMERFSVIPSGYWNDHYRLGVKADSAGGMIGSGSCEGLMINAVIPFLFFYGKEKKMDEYCDKAITWLESLRPEANKLVRRFEFVGIKSLNAADTQGLLNMDAHYCSQRKCLDCVIGRKLLAG